jgi:hypothetical protein
LKKGSVKIRKKLSRALWGEINSLLCVLSTADKKKSEICKKHKEEVHTRKNHAWKFPILKKSFCSEKIGKSEIVWVNFSVIR